MQHVYSINEMKAGLAYLSPELILTGGILLIILAGIIGHKKPALWAFSLLIFVSTIALAGFEIVAKWPETNLRLFSGFLQHTDFAAFFKLLVLAGCLLTAGMSRKKNIEHPAEYFTLLLSVALGCALFVMSNHAVIFLLSLELISLPSYVLTGAGRGKAGAEGSLKYFLFGSTVTAVMIFGWSLLYSVTGTFDFTSPEFVEQLTHHAQPAAYLASALIISGLLFKLSAVPFHFWAPDTYQAAPTPVAAFFSTVPKLAGLAVLAKIFLAFHLFGQSSVPYASIAGVLAIISITVGNIGALRQKNVKRLMAYSSIAQAGFLLLALVPFDLSGIHTLQFYAIVYLVMNFASFYVIGQFDHHHNAELLEDFRGRARTGWVSAIVISVGMIALTGLPPTGGFMAKLILFSSLWSSSSISPDLRLILLILGLLNTVVALVYYLKIPYYLFIKSRPEETKPLPWELQGLFGVLLALALLAAFVHPGLLMGWINKTTFVL
jgi:NADH-quinone oxidoreductase subunit N